MKRYGFLLVVVLAASLLACKSEADKQGSLILHFKAFYDGQPLSMLVTKPFNGTEQLQFTHLSFFVSDLVLLDQSNTINLKDVELVDLSFDDLASADAGYTLRFDNLDAKSYSGIRFGIGVPPDANAKKPQNFSSGNPLSNSIDYWSAWDSYIFMKTEGRIDTLGNGTFDLGYAYHTGTNDLYRIIEGNLPISIEEGKNKVLDIDLDYKKLLAGIDIKGMPLNSNPKDSIQIGKLVKNLANSLTLVQ